MVLSIYKPCWVGTTKDFWDGTTKDFWDVYGQPISIIAGGFAGGVASLLFDRLKRSKKEDEETYTSERVRKDHT